MPKVSIVIPVFNKWNLTRNCLKSIAANTSLNFCEIIVVDNASTDETSRGAPFLGNALFGENFKYIRNETNRNFAGASNQGADAASGEYTLFLNNDTEVRKGWLEELLKDFINYPDIAATGPLLLYPDETPLGKQVQHMGVFISPLFRLGHLYQWIPASSPLAQKRRFFQVITAACMLIPKKAFMDIGKFDEEFINGFEDVDLCARLTAKGHRMTVNPKAVVIHHESKSPGRHAHEERNGQLLKAKSLHLLRPDWHSQLQADGLKLTFSKWQRFSAETPNAKAPDVTKMSIEELKLALYETPYLQSIWEELINRSAHGKEREFFCETYVKLFPEPKNLFTLLNMPWAQKDFAFKASMAARMRQFVTSPRDYLEKARFGAELCSKRAPELANKFEKQTQDFDKFREKDFPELASALWKLERSLGKTHSPTDKHAYNTWLYAVDKKRREKIIDAFMTDFNSEKENFPRISLLMPVYNPKPEYLRAALDSVRDQVYPAWELCVADDASTNPEIAKILKEYAVKDARIKVVFREKNGNIAKATNSALALTTSPWIGLMNQEDLLTPDALAFVAKAIRDNPDALLLFSDEDKTDDGKSFYMPYFKNNRWDPELIVVQNYVNHLAVYKKERMGDGFRAEFPVARDHDFVLRYTDGMDPDRIIHIPYVLYHWRAHAGSAAQDTSAKTYATDSRNKAAQAWLDRRHPGAKVKNNIDSDWRRVVYPLPERPPAVSLVLVHSQKAFPLIEYLTSWRQKTALPFELTLLTDKSNFKTLKNIARGQNIKVMAAPEKLSNSEKLLLGAKSSPGTVIGFISPDVVPLADGWLEEILACLTRPGVGAVGGKLVYKNGDMVDGGFLADASGSVKAVFMDHKIKEDSWFGWTRLTRTVDAVNGACLFTCKELALKNGLDSSMGDWSLEDYCLRLGQAGLRTVWLPCAEFTLLAPNAKTKRIEVFSEKWRDKITPVNENILALGSSWELADPDDGKFDFSAPEYLKLNPDLLQVGVNPLSHYLRYGLIEGRKGRLSHIDYSELT